MGQILMVEHAEFTECPLKLAPINKLIRNGNN